MTRQKVFPHPNVGALSALSARAGLITDVFYNLPTPEVGALILGTLAPTLLVIDGHRLPQGT